MHNFHSKTMFRFVTAVTSEQFTQQQILASQHILNEYQSSSKQVGRPKRKSEIQDVLIDKDNNTSTQSTKRTNYINWFESEHIHDILEAYRIKGTGFKAVQYLNRQFPKLLTESCPRFANLAPSTIDGWFDENGKLLKQFDDQLKGRNKLINSGRPKLINEELETIIIKQLQAIRKSGAAIHIKQIRMFIKAIVKRYQPELLDKLKLGNSFISYFARHTDLQWRCRRATTVAGKLPENWHSQGISSVPCSILTLCY